jgi:hypothetical protein
VERRREGPQTPYEVYCYQCQASFALGTRNCVHCGSRLARSEVPLETVMGPGPSPGTEGSEGADESPVVSMVRRLSGATLWLVFVLVALLARMCEGG